MTDVTVVEVHETLTVTPAPAASLVDAPAKLTVVETPYDLIVQESTATLTVSTSGAQGPPGPSGGGFTFTQSSPSAAWTVPHNLHRFPNVSYVDASGHAWIADVQHVDVDTAYLTFPAPTTGKAVCS